MATVDLGNVVGPQGEKGDIGASGPPGFSPSVTIEQSGDITTIEVTDEEGTRSASIDLSDYAKKEGNYELMIAGNAEQLISTGRIEDSKPYLMREVPSGVGNLAYIDKLVGGTVAWNQLMPKTTSVYGSVSGVTASVDEDGFVNITGTASASGDITVSPGPAGNVPANHVILITAWGKGDVRVGRNGFGAGGNNYVFSKHTADFYVGAYFRIDNGNTYDCKKKVCCHDLTDMFNATIADYAYALEQQTAGAGIAWLQSYSFFTKDYYAPDGGSLQSVNPTSHIVKDGDGNVISTTAFDDVTLRGILKTDENGNLYYEGDEYLPDGTLRRNFGERAYQVDDESLTDAITDGTNTVYKLDAPTTESVDPFTAVHTVEEGGTEEYVGSAIPVGHETRYTIDLKGKLEAIPELPSASGTYVLQATVSASGVTYAWVSTLEENSDAHNVSDISTLEEISDTHNVSDNSALEESSDTHNVSDNTTLV